MSAQVSKEHYDFRRYVGLDRWSSYHVQLGEILSAAPRSVLEVGVGDGVVRSYLRSHTDITYTSLDIAHDLSPDIVGSVEKIPMADGAVECVVAFEVLEHLPFERLSGALAEMARVTRDTVIISLPHFGPPLKLLIKFPYLPEMRLAIKIPYPRRHVFNGQHFWEIGKRGYPLSRILKEMAGRFAVIRHYVPFENQYHHFFILKKKATDEPQNMVA